MAGGKKTTSSKASTDTAKNLNNKSAGKPAKSAASSVSSQKDKASKKK